MLDVSIFGGFLTHLARSVASMPPRRRHDQTVCHKQPPCGRKNPTCRTRAPRARVPTLGHHLPAATIVAIRSGSRTALGQDALRALTSGRMARRVANWPGTPVMRGDSSIQCAAGGPSVSDALLALRASQAFGATRAMLPTRAPRFVSLRPMSSRRASRARTAGRSDSQSEPDRANRCAADGPSDRSLTDHAPEGVHDQTEGRGRSPAGNRPSPTDRRRNEDETGTGPSNGRAGRRPQGEMEEEER